MRRQTALPLALRNVKHRTGSWEGQGRPGFKRTRQMIVLRRLAFPCNTLVYAYVSKALVTQLSRPIAADNRQIVFAINGVEDCITVQFLYAYN